MKGKLCKGFISDELIDKDHVSPLHWVDIPTDGYFQQIFLIFNKDPFYEDL